MATYKTKSAKVEAVKFTCINLKEVMNFINTNRLIVYKTEDTLHCIVKNNGIDIHVEENKYIVKGSDEEFYACSEDSFESMYEKVN